MEQLKNCPFCGGEAHIEFSYVWWGYFVSCTVCGATQENYDKEEEAIEAWNRRASDE